MASAAWLNNWSQPGQCIPDLQAAITRFCSHYLGKTKLEDSSSSNGGGSVVIFRLGILEGKPGIWIAWYSARYTYLKYTLIKNYK